MFSENTIISGDLNQLYPPSISTLKRKAPIASESHLTENEIQIISPPDPRLQLQFKLHKGVGDKIFLLSGDVESSSEEVGVFKSLPPVQ